MVGKGRVSGFNSKIVQRRLALAQIAGIIASASNKRTTVLNCGNANLPGALIAVLLGCNLRQVDHQLEKRTGPLISNQPFIFLK